MTIAEGILQDMMKRIKLYQCLLVSRESSKCVFQVTYASSNLAHNSTLRNHSLTLHNGNIAVGNDYNVRDGVMENTNPIPNVCTDNVNRNNNNDNNISTAAAAAGTDEYNSMYHVQKDNDKQGIMNSNNNMRDVLEGERGRRRRMMMMMMMIVIFM